MQGGFEGRNRVKSVSFRGEPDVNNSIDPRQRNSFREREEHQQREHDDARLVKLLPDANMTISVHNDYRDSRLRGRGGILKSNSFRDDTNLSYNNERTSQPSNRGFEAFRSRGRGGRPRGFYHGNNPGNYYQDYENHNDINQRSFRGRPMSGNYDQNFDKTHEYNNSNNRYNRGRQTSDSQKDYDGKGQEMQPGPGGNRGRGNNNRTNHSNYSQDSSVNKDEQKQPGQKPFRGRSKSANDPPRSGRGRGRGRGRGKHAPPSDATAPVTAEGDHEVGSGENGDGGVARDIDGSNSQPKEGENVPSETGVDVPEVAVTGTEVPEEVVESKQGQDEATEQRTEPSVPDASDPRTTVEEEANPTVPGQPDPATTDPDTTIDPSSNDQ